jgi:hypothetical protein
MGHVACVRMMGNAYETLGVKPYCDTQLWNLFTGENIFLNL